MGFLPSGKIYPVRNVNGEALVFKKTVLIPSVFHYFDGYGLYEDADFTLRVVIGKYLNTAANYHFHNPAGRQISMVKWWCAMVGMYGELKILDLR
jgi:hypothetical protein